MSALDREVERLSGRVLAAWVAGPAFRARYTPDPGMFWSVKHQAIAKACVALARLGVKAWENGDLGTALVEQLAASGDLAKYPLGESPLPLVVVRDPDGDLERLRQVAALHGLTRELAHIERCAAESLDLKWTRSALLDALSASSVGAPMLAYSQQEGLAKALLAAGKDSAGESSGLPSLDKNVGGLRQGHCWVVGAPTNWGKTSLALAIADHFKGPTLLVTCEDAPDLIFRRLLARRASVSGIALRDGKLTPKELDAVHEQVHTAKSYGTVPFLLDGRGQSVERIGDYIRNSQHVHGFKLIIVDYLQCIRTERKTDDRRGEINHVARTLTDAIKTSGAAGILTSQLTGEDIRESRDVEHAAEVVLIGRKNAGGELTLFVKKSKTGPADTAVDMQLNKETGAMHEKARESDQWDTYIPSWTEVDNEA